MGYAHLLKIAQSGIKSMSNTVKLGIGIIAEIQLGGKPQSLILETIVEKKDCSLKGSLKLKDKVSIGDIILKDLAPQVLGSGFIPDDRTKETTSLLTELGLNLHELTLIYQDTANQKNFTFICYSQLELSQEPDKNLNIQIAINFKSSTQKDKQSTLKIDLNIQFSDYIFKLGLLKQNNDIFFIAAFKSATEGFQIRALINCISSKLAEYIPESLKFNINQIIFIYSKDSQNQGGETSKLLFGIDLGIKIDLKDLPLIGEKIPAQYSCGIESFKFIIASEAFSLPTELSKNLACKEENSQLALSFLDNIQETQPGLLLSATMKLSEEKHTLSFPPPALPKLSPSAPKKSEAKPIETFTFSAADSTLWCNLDKTLGPLRLKRIGLQYFKSPQEQIIFLLLDTSLSVLGLTLTTEGLGVGYSLTKSEIKFKLRGLAIDYQSQTKQIQIGGAFLWQELNDEDKKQFEFKFAGAAVVKTTTFALSAIGAYAQMKSGAPSLLLYAVLEQPLGGPPCFFVTGLALGFGYNRAFNVPKIEELAEFPLVKVATSEGGSAGELLPGLQKLDSYIPPRAGHHFLAVGVKFTSFKIIDSFALLVASFGERFELHLLGLSTLTSPPKIITDNLGIEPISRVQLAFIATFRPDEGTLQVRGKILPGSYLFVPEAELSGGFALYAWFTGEHKGDFVFTMGGYHPEFQVPAHYPQVERLSFNLLNVKGTNISIKGNVYFALTPSAIMAGGHMEVTYKSGAIKAWYIYDVNFLIAWQPFHYDAKINVHIGASYTYQVLGISQTLSIDVGAKLHIWGPEFSGTAHIDLKVTSVTIAFGKGADKVPEPLKWEEFKKSFLPADNEICQIAIKGGLIRTFGHGQSAIKIVNPKELSLVVNSAIPCKNIIVTNTGQKFESQVQFGIASMNVKSKDLNITMTIEMERERENSEVFYQISSDDFKFQVTQNCNNFPKSLWGESIQPTLEQTKPIENVLAGCEFKLEKKALKSDFSEYRDIKDLLVNEVETPYNFNWQLPPKLQKRDKNIELPKVTNHELLNYLEKYLEFTDEEIKEVNSPECLEYIDKKIKQTAELLVSI